MKLYLSSVGIPDPKAYAGLFTKNQAQHIAVITTAWNVAPQTKSEPFIRRTEQILHELGFSSRRVDLADFGSNPTKLRDELADATGLWITGGNTFYLNYWMHQSGFDKLLPDLLANDVVYGGESAGAVVAGKTLHGIELLDDPAEAPAVLWEGLGLVDYGIIPHWGEKKYGELLEQSCEEMKLFCSVKALMNSDFITVY